RREPRLRHAEASSVDLRVPGAEAPEPDAAGAVALGQAVNHDHPVFHTSQREGAYRLSAIVDELSIYLVADQEQIVLLAKTRDELELLPRVDGARRVVGVADDHHPGLRRDDLLPGGLVWEVEAILGA